MNIKLARLLKIPHVNCTNHLLNNEIKHWFEQGKEGEEGYIVGDPNNAKIFKPGAVCQAVNKTMKDLSTNKSRAMLQQETQLVPTFHNDTRWSSHANEMTKWMKIEEHAQSVATTPGSNVTMPPNSIYYFKQAAKNTKLMLDDMNACVVHLQEQLMPLSESRDAVEELIFESETNSTNPASHWYGNKLTKVYIAPDSKSVVT